MHMDPGNLARLVHDKERALWHTRWVARAIEVGHLALWVEVAEQGICDAKLFCPGDQRVTGIHADAEHLRLERVEALQFGLIRRHLRGAGAAEGKREEG